jgi:hypothetical protein
MDSFCGDYIAREIYLDGVSDAEIRWDYPGCVGVFGCFFVAGDCG